MVGAAIVVYFWVLAILLMFWHQQICKRSDDVIHEKMVHRMKVAKTYEDWNEAKDTWNMYAASRFTDLPFYF